MLTRGQKVSRILSRNDGSHAVDEIYKMLYPIFTKKPKKLREEERDVCLILDFFNTVKNNGFKGFYISEHGNHAVDISRGLSKIDAIKTYEYYYESMQVFSGMIAEELMLRQMYYDNNQEKCDEIWQVLDERIDEFKDEINEKIISYVRENILEFR